MASAAPAKQARSDPAYDLAEKLKTSVGMALPNHITREQFSRAFLTALRKNSELVECTQQSISTAVVTAAQLGLMIGVNGACWLLPFKNKGVKECELIIGYQGLVDLCYRSGLVDSVFTDVVCENDEFTYQQGLDQHLNHRPNLHSSRGAPYAVYAIARTKGSTAPVYVVLNKDEIETVKKSSKAYQSDLKYGSKRSPWSGDFETEMWKKTAIRRLCKLLPKSVELVRALEFEDRESERWAEAAVVDDPFAAGRNILPAKSSAPVSIDNQQDSAQEELTENDIIKRDEAYAYLNGVYNDHPDIDELLANHDQPSLMEIPKDTKSLEQIAALVEVAKLISARG